MSLNYALICICQNSYNSFATVDSEADLEVGGGSVKTGTGAGRRRLSSNADMPDYGSWCSLQRRWMSMVENSLTPTEFSHSQSHANITNPHFGSSPGIKTASLSHNENLKWYFCSFRQNIHSIFFSPKAAGRSNAVLGLAIIIQTPDSSSQNIFLKQNLVIEDIFSQLYQSVKQVNVIHFMHLKSFLSLSGLHPQEKICLHSICWIQGVSQVIFFKLLGGFSLIIL